MPAALDGPESQRRHGSTVALLMGLDVISVLALPVLIGTGVGRTGWSSPYLAAIHTAV